MYATSAMTLVQPHVAHSWCEAGVPWRVRAEFVGATEKGNDSHKFWEMYSDGKDGSPVYINWGKVGSSGQKTPLARDFWDAKQVLEEKLDKGYRIVPQSVAGSPRKIDPATASFLALAYEVRNSGTGGYLLMSASGSVLMELTEEGAREALLSPLIRQHSKLLNLPPP